MKSRKRTIHRLLAIAGAVLILSLAGVVAAHPLGNFTISRYSALTLRDEAIDVLYIVDMAEIPTFQERQAMDTNGDGNTSTAEVTVWVEGMVPALASGLRLVVDGEPVSLAAGEHNLTFPPGQGDLETLRLEITLAAVLPPVDSGAPRQVVYEDTNFAGRIGWQEVIASAADGSLLETSVPATGLSDGLRDYPADRLQAPPTVNRAEISHAPAVAALIQDAQPTGSGEEALTANRFSSDEFANLLNRTLDTPGALAAALLVAVGLGAAHALTPGHGKTIVGAYLVGSRGTARHALFLGLTTTITHTAGVFFLGFLVLAASEFILPETLYPWLGVLSGLLVVFIGGSILRGHLRHWRTHRHDEAHDHGSYHFHFGKGHSHDHGPRPLDHGPRPTDHNGTDHTTHAGSVSSGNGLAFAGVMNPAVIASPLRARSNPVAEHKHHHDLDHAHDHPHPHKHEHLHPSPGERDALSWRNLLALGISGGLLPCPSALILMLSAIALRQVGVGLVLIVAFSIGLAGVLTGIGLIMIYAGRMLERLPVRHTALTARLLPIASATFITLAGLLITWRALAEAGVL